jgi:hypothetical protein
MLDHGLCCSEGGVEHLADVRGSFPGHDDRLRPLDRVKSERAQELEDRSRIATQRCARATVTSKYDEGETVNSTDGGYEVSYGRNSGLRCVCGSCRDYSTSRRPRRYVPEGYTGRAPSAVPGAHFPDYIKPWE